MGVNGYQGQIRAIDQPNGYFAANAEIFTLIQNLASVNVDYIERIGIQVDPITRGITTQSTETYDTRQGSTTSSIQLPKYTTIQVPTKVLINNKEIQIGKTGIYEVDNVEITSIKFVENSPKNAIIDFVVKKGV